MWVNYATVKGTANGIDCTAKSGTLTFAPGTTTLSVKLPDDSGHRRREQRDVLGEAVGCKRCDDADNVGLGTIINNDYAVKSRVLGFGHHGGNGSLRQPRLAPAARATLPTVVVPGGRAADWQPIPQRR